MQTQWGIALIKKIKIMPVHLSRKMSNQLYVHLNEINFLCFVVSLRVTMECRYVSYSIQPTFDCV